MNKTDRFHYFLLLPLHTELEDGAKEQERSGGLKCLWEILFCSASGKHEPFCLGNYKVQSIINHWWVYFISWGTHILW